MKNLGYIASEITKGKNLSDNLVKYGKGLSSLYNGLAYIKMSMNYYTILNMIKDNEIDDELFLEMFQGVNEIIEISSIDSAVASEDVLTDKISSLRNRLIAIMESITDYVDKFKIYEYVLNRVEYRFKDDELDEEYYNTYMTNDIMHYILSDKDNVSINGRISEMVGQLPIRMSKARFYDHIKDAFTLYHGAQKQTIDDFYYSLSTSAMLKDADKDSMLFKDMNDFYVTLKNADYKNLDSSEYTRLRGALDIATEKMNNAADIYVLLAQIINDLYTIILSDNNTIGDNTEVNVAKDIILKSKSLFEDEQELDEIAELFTAFEGKQERILETVMAADFATQYAAANLNDTLDELALSDMYSSLEAIGKLQSGSDFVDISPKEYFDEIPDDSYADMAAEKLITELDRLFTDCQQSVKRAVMAAVLSMLPVFFNNTEEIQDYINSSLIQCSDEAEKKAVVEVVRMIIAGQ